MKKLIEIMVATAMIFSLVACGEKTSDSSKPQHDATPDSASISNSSTVNSDENNTQTTPEPAQSSDVEKVASAKDGTLTLSKADIAVVINGTSVPMPFKLKELESAGVPADESRDGMELGAGDYITANLYLDDSEDYVLVPSYYNKGDSAISIFEAEAQEISMTSFADNPTDKGVSILGISFGMTKSEVKALLGEPVSDEGEGFEWHIEVPDMNYEGTLSIYVAEDSDTAGVSQVTLSVTSK